jgi:hypothetical protein
MRVATQSLRVLAFRISVVSSVIAIVLVPFYEHWFTKLGYAAMSSNRLHIWLNFGLTASLIALLGSLFGRGSQRVVATVISIAEIYYWFVLSIAV